MDKTICELARSLSIKQLKFAQLVLAGYSATGAYREAYKSAGKAHTCQVEGWRLSRHPVIAQLLSLEKAQRIISREPRTIELQNEVLDALLRTLQAAEASGSVSRTLRAIKMLGDHVEVRAFSNSSNTTAANDATYDDAIQQFESTLACSGLS